MLVCCARIHEKGNTDQNGPMVGSIEDLGHTPHGAGSFKTIHRLKHVKFVCEVKYHSVNEFRQD